MLRGGGGEGRRGRERESREGRRVGMGRKVSLLVERCFDGESLVHIRRKAGGGGGG